MLFRSLHIILISLAKYKIEKKSCKYSSDSSQRQRHLIYWSASLTQHSSCVSFTTRLFRRKRLILEINFDELSVTMFHKYACRY